ncbi:DUF4333 domain-containing protein [Streptomyces sp. OR43]|uniref:DUF4333 domain-containing protein n=1 Tax=Streptomyces sp. or43 TaxID=2478957 RepID=UPI0011CE7C4B|nr:DUF4333 domain-containing protein [Streptomyces sp. or43]TXS49419.1 DUF4333 domain-containing protein [Streptomyces sp. or43]
MTDQRSFARRVMAASSVVVAVCAVIVTTKVMNTDTDLPTEPVVLDPVAVEQAVQARIGPKTDRVSCPVYLVAEDGKSFTCTYWVKDIPNTVEVKMMGGQGEFSLSG